jgi:hypothetical protein
MPENPGLCLRMTVTENLQFFAELYGVANAAQPAHRPIGSTTSTSPPTTTAATSSPGRTPTPG